ncbi:TolC family outer membrane protein [Terasakiella sp. SH-1]|uniref:TolC family outer membrane protein n=1 Tax=Terasakiella sp. SH-1 TaxID=2560057 RepID=UPI001073570B|nr:TolC family outer membrane protein [Terasakiella sp. SH-1]
MRARYFISTCIGALMAFSATTETLAASLETELSNMLVDHPKLKAAQKTTQSATKNIDVQEAAQMPTVSVTSDYGYEWITNPTERSNSDGKDDSSMMRQTAGITVTQNLFDGFAKNSNVRKARLSKEEQSFEENKEEQTLLLEGIETYLNVLKHARRIDYAKENEANIRTQMELEDERVRRGSGIGIDVLNAKSRLQTAKDKRVEYEGNLAKAADQYMQIFGHAPDIAAMVDPNPPLDLIPQTMDEAIEIALKTNPQLLKQDVTAEIAKENKRTVQAEYYPSVDLVGSMNYERDKGATAGTRRDYSVLLEANWDLFSGFSTEYSMKKAVFDYAASKNTYEYTARKQIEGTRKAWHNLETTRERLSLKENDVILKEEIFIDTRKQRENGAEGVDVLNVLDREKEVYETKIQYAELFYDTRLAIYSVLFATGQLTPDVLNLE